MTEKMLRMSGKDPVGNAKAIRTDLEGNVGVNFTTSDIALPVDLQYINLADSEALPVKQIRKQLSTTFHSRAARKENSIFVYVDVPANAIGAVIKLKNYGLTGQTFIAGQGIRLQTVLTLPQLQSSMAELSTTKLQTIFPHVCIFYPGFAFGNLTAYSATTPPEAIKGSGVPITHMRIGVRIQIDGTFDTTGGFDCEVTADWIF